MYVDVFVYLQLQFGDRVIGHSDSLRSKVVRDDFLGGLRQEHIDKILQGVERVRCCLNVHFHGVNSEILEETSFMRVWRRVLEFRGEMHVDDVF